MGIESAKLKKTKHRQKDISIVSRETSKTCVALVLNTRLQNGKRDNKQDFMMIKRGRN